MGSDSSLDFNFFLRPSFVHMSKILQLQLHIIRLHHFIMQIKVITMMHNAEDTTPTLIKNALFNLWEKEHAKKIPLSLTGSSDGQGVTLNYIVQNFEMKNLRLYGKQKLVKKTYPEYWSS